MFYCLRTYIADSTLPTPPSTRPSSPAPHTPRASQPRPSQPS